MKKFVFALACLLAVNSSAYAAAIDKAVADADTKRMTVEGSLGESVNGKKLTLMVLKGSAEENAVPDAQPDKIEYADILYVNESGVYTKEFGFDVSTGYYTAVTVDELGKVSTQTVFYVNKTELDEFAEKVGSGEISGDAVIAGITTYKDMLAADMTYFANSRNRSMLVTEINDNLQEIQTGKAAKLKSVIQTAETKCKFLDAMQNATTWYEVDNLITCNTALHNLTFTDYDKVADKSKVCTPFIGTEMESMKAFTQKFTELVADNQPSQSVENDKVTLGGGFGGGGISGGYITKDDKIDTDNQEAEDNNTDTEKGTFLDVAKSHWASEAIEALCAEGVLSGMGDGSFAPEQVVTRGEAAKIIALAFGINASETELTFSDVTAESWQYPYVSALYAAEITTGKSDTKYGVDDGVTREDLAVLLYRVLNRYDDKQETTAKTFADDAAIADYAREAVSYMSGLGIINGTDNNRFEPKAFATRAQVAKLVYEMTKILK